MYGLAEEARQYWFSLILLERFWSRILCMPVFWMAREFRFGISARLYGRWRLHCLRRTEYEVRSMKYDGVASLFDLFAWGKGKMVSLFSLQITGAADSPDYERFYQVAGKDFTEAAFKDDDKLAGLEPDTVYIYRVRSCVDTSCTPWSHESAGKTLRESPVGASVSPDIRPICTSNSYCNYDKQFSKKVSFELSDLPSPLVSREESQRQCSVNADCANVGRSQQTFKER